MEGQLSVFHMPCPPGEVTRLGQAERGFTLSMHPGYGEGPKAPVLRHYAAGVTDTVTINGVLRRALLAYNARAVHAGGEAAAHVSAFLAEVAADVLALLDAGQDPVQRKLLAEAYRCLTSLLTTRSGSRAVSAMSW
ncbi:hypothetical protein JHN49_33420 [Streptomyces sp. MBT57]|nr:hypothetical protein [Streptomyces sp. MBT57]